MSNHFSSILTELQAHLTVVLFTVFYVVAFTAVFVYRGGYEFLWYAAVLLAVFTLIVLTLHRSRFDSFILWGLSIWGLLHMAGGGIPAGDGVLYGLTLIPIVDAGNELILLKYDQVVHFFGFAVATIVVYHLLRPYLSGHVSWSIIFIVVALAGMGLGVVNEIIEFIATLIFPETGVGGYNNTALDLVFNTLGAIAAALYLAFYREEKVYAPQHGFLGKVKRMTGLGR